MTIPKLAPYSMDAFQASSGNNEYTRYYLNSLKMLPLSTGRVWDGQYCYEYIWATTRLFFENWVFLNE